MLSQSALRKSGRMLVPMLLARPYKHADDVCFMWRQCCLESAHRTAQETIFVKECIAPKNQNLALLMTLAYVGRYASASCGM